MNETDLQKDPYALRWNKHASNMTIEEMQEVLEWFDSEIQRHDKRRGEVIEALNKKLHKIKRHIHDIR